MPKAFSEQEKDIVRGQLRSKGLKLLETYGIRKTSVEELARAAGISKGAFYLFYDSKEELFLEILEQLEADFRERVFEVAASDSQTAYAILAAFLKEALLAWDRYPLLKKLGLADFEYLARKVPPERIRQHANQDEAFAEQLLRRIKMRQLKIKASPREVSNLTTSLFLISLHREQFSEAAYHETMQILADLIARYIVDGRR